MEQNTKSAVLHYALHETPPHITYHANGVNYMILLDGRTFFDCGNGMTIPATGCPCPEKLPMANLLHFLLENRKWIPAAFGVCALLVISHTALLVSDGGEMAAAWLAAFSFWMNLTLIVLACLAVISLGMYNFKKGAVIQWGEKEAPMLLNSGSISIAPDLLLLSDRQDEAPDEYRVRVELALANIQPGCWIVVMPFRQNFGVIQCSNSIDEVLSGYVFLRSNPIHDGGVEITHAQAQLSANVYLNETWGDYVGYCHEFAARFKKWAIVEKMTGKNNLITTVLQNMAVAIALLLFAVPAFAQKSAQVREYLGEFRYSKDAPAKGADVSFIFKKAVLSRVGDGAKTYAELLPAGAYYQDDSNMGALIGITVGKEVITPVGRAAKITTNQAEVSAIPVDEIENEKSFLERLPDSTELTVMKAEHLASKAAEWRTFKPILDYYMWRFWGIMVILFGIGGAFWVLSKVSAKDSIKDLQGYAFLGNAITGMHIWSKTVLFCLMAFPTLVIILNDAIRSYYTEVFGFWFCVKYAAVYWIWQWVFEKVLPDSPGTNAGRSQHFGNYPSNQRQLNG